MILTDVLTASDMNPMYYKFIPIFIRAWKRLFPEVNIHIILIADELIDELVPYSEFIKLFKPIPDIKSSFIAQNIRLFYPGLLKSEGGILITDMDIIPMNRHYYTDPIKDIECDKFVCYRQLECVGKDEMVMCYNIATSEIWQNVFSVKSESDIRYIMSVLNKNVKYVGHINMPFWITDQLYLYETTQRWNKVTNNLVILNDNMTGFNRLDRGRIPNQDYLINLVGSRLYSDYHMCRPYDDYKSINDFIVNLL